MTNEPVQRRLAAILAADVAGYSRLMGEDEAGTLAAVRKLRAEVIEPKIAEHYGRLFKTMGDGFLVEFSSVVNAVACAVAIQKLIAVRNADLPEDQHLQLRIGVHLGDVISEGNDIFGDGVNTAARIEALAPPGSVAVSAMVHDNVGSRLDLAFEDAGEQQLKNIAKPLRIYHVSTASRQAPKAAPSRQAERSIAVLPFTNMSGHPEQEYFSDGLTEDIITDLSNVPGFLVIARNSTFAYKGKSVDVRQIARELGVKYILEGSARRSEHRLRVNAQLINAADGGNHIWAERFDREIANIFDIQDEIAKRVVEAISGKFGTTLGSERYRPKDLEAYDLCVRSRNMWSVSNAANDEAISNLRRAIAIDANYCEAHWRLSNALYYSWFHWGHPQDPNKRDSMFHAERAVEIDPGDSNARVTLGSILLYERRWDEAELQLNEALRQTPNNADAHIAVAEFYTCVGRHKEGLEEGNTALRLNPKPPGWYYWMLGILQFMNGQYNEAISTLRREETYRSNSRRVLAAALAMAGRESEAKVEARLFLSTSPHFRVSKWIESSAIKHKQDVEFWTKAYLLAGLPD